ncbi:MAG TPA: Spy/CpxP family protein refolding chaperone [Xanthobacteraceae bacterium]|nr:Spy/CpxP family protein refolding chaperone [Xanthobacteraceae bacterium]
MRRDFAMRRGNIRMAGPRDIRAARRAYANRAIGGPSARAANRALAARQGNMRLTPRELRRERALARMDARNARIGAGRSAALMSSQAGAQRRAAFGSRHAIGTAFAARQVANAGWYRNWRLHKRIAFGWYGPLFWPYAYDSIFNNVFWPYAYNYDPFWDYGYGDIYSAVFYPYTYDELIDIPPPPGGDRRVVTGSISPRSGPVARTIQRLAPLCGDDAREIAGVPIDSIQAAVNPNDTQNALLDELGNASVKAAQIVKDACPSDIAMTPTGRLAAMKTRIEAMTQAVATVREPLEKFYNSLSDEQKARFDAIGQRGNQKPAPNSLTGRCSVGEATQWPTDQIERVVRPTAAQRDALEALKRASDGAADLLRTSCPAETPMTPSARFEAISARLNAMLDAINTVSGPLDAFYGSLSNEQKAQFNAIGRQRAIRQG